MPEKKTDSIVYWIRSDLRLSDKIAWWEAAKPTKNLFVVYIKNLPMDPQRLVLQQRHG